ncbi:MAG: PaaI family thioesterase [Defluviimonas sp.]|uniref:PaaI family thioesterase n=1 Tax=Albidovulum sp. TaxID=1872424 RepID=UPI001DC3DAEA|nr:PaaI family thioesterase [Paracoccaceae bacterium]MCC0064169.1 PaaI family thioesterase [Defluviimonas sp.]
MQAVMTEAELMAFMRRAFAQVAEEFRVERLTADGIVMRLKVDDRHLRPGGTVSGPSIFALADVAVYLAILARIGPVALAVTTNGTVDFLRKPAAGVDLLAEARLLKLGRVLAVGDVLIRSEGSDAPVARSNMTYSIPPRREQF